MRKAKPSKAWTQKRLADHARHLERQLDGPGIASSRAWHVYKKAELLHEITVMEAMLAAAEARHAEPEEPELGVPGLATEWRRVLRSTRDLA